MTTGDRFLTGVRGSTAEWPAPPQVWGYSSLREAEECPRRWMLTRATYPLVWSRAGYPPRPTLASLFGDIVHRVLELILIELHAHNCRSLADPSSVQVLKSLGGYSKLAEYAIEERLERLEGNPRIAAGIDGLRRTLHARVPDMRQRVQLVIARTLLIPRPSTGSQREGADGGGERGPLAEGSHPEVELRAPSLRLVGRADLITLTGGRCAITDYKTGSPDTHHADQLRTYALLWTRDSELNPDGLPVGRLTVAYTTHDDTVEPPGLAELQVMATDVERRVAHADQELLLRPPPARPAPDLCRYCAVRHLCDDYWVELKPGEAVGRDVDFADCEGVITNQNGPRSWILELVPDRRRVLVRTPNESPGFAVGDRLRLLSVTVAHDEDMQGEIATITAASEVFVVGG